MFNRAFFGYEPLYVSKDPRKPPAIFWSKPFLHACCSHGTTYYSSSALNKQKIVYLATFFFGDARWQLGTFFFGDARWELLTSPESPRESFLAAYDCCLAHPTPSHAPQGTCFNFVGCCCLRGAVAVRKQSAKRSVGGCFLVS